MNRKIMANEYKNLCSESNKMVKMKNGSVTSNGWTKIDGKYDKRTNFKGVLFEKNNEYTLCFVGTDKWNYKDHAANLQMAATGDSSQIREARDFANKMQQVYGINNMGDCNDAVPLDNYKQTHPLFIDKISEKDISRKEIGEMTSDLFKVYEKVIDERMERGCLRTPFIKEEDDSCMKPPMMQERNTSQGGTKTSWSEQSKWQSSENRNTSSGKWVTINGNHVLIKG